MDSALKNELTPFYEPGQVLTGTCVGAVTGKRFVKIGGSKNAGSFGLSSTSEGGNIKIKAAEAADKLVVGVSGRDGADKENILFYGPGFIVPVLANEAINAGEEVGVGAGGKAVKAVASSKAEIEEGKPDYKVPAVGIAYADAEANKDVMVRVYA